MRRTLRPPPAGRPRAPRTRAPGRTPMLVASGRHQRSPGNSSRTRTARRCSTPPRSGTCRTTTATRQATRQTAPRPGGPPISRRCSPLHLTLISRISVAGLLRESLLEFGAAAGIVRPGHRPQMIRVMVPGIALPSILEAAPLVPVPDHRGMVVIGEILPERSAVPVQQRTPFLVHPGQGPGRHAGPVGVSRPAIRPPPFHGVPPRHFVVRGFGIALRVFGPPGVFRRLDGLPGEPAPVVAQPPVGVPAKVRPVAGPVPNSVARGTAVPPRLFAARTRRPLPRSRSAVRAPLPRTRRALPGACPALAKARLTFTRGGPASPAGVGSPLLQTRTRPALTGTRPAFTRSRPTTLTGVSPPLLQTRTRTPISPPLTRTRPPIPTALAGAAGATGASALAGPRRAELPRRAAVTGLPGGAGAVPPRRLSGPVLRR